MTPVAMLFIRTALLMLVAGIAIGAATLAEPSWLTRERSMAHAHLLVVGWLLNMVFGVAWWMFPRVPDSVARAPYVVAGWAALNAGLLLRVGMDLFGDGALQAPVAVRWTSAGLQLAGIVLLAALVWRRVRPPSLRPRQQPPQSPQSRPGPQRR